MARNYFNFNVKQEDRKNWSLVITKWKSTETTTYKGQEMIDYLGTVTIPKPALATASKTKKSRKAAVSDVKI
jgi:hypothetical protein